MNAHHVSTLLLCLLAVAALTSSAAAQEEFKVVVHAECELDSLTTKGTSRLFLKKDKTWPDGSKVRPIDQPKSSRVRLAFLEGVHDLDEEGYARYWVRLVFAGRAKPPEIASSDSDVLQKVQQDPTAIGYVSRGQAVPAGLKVLSVQPTPD